MEQVLRGIASQEEAKKAVQNARVKVYKEVYEKLDTKEVENDIYRIARIRDRKTRYLCTVRRVKDEDQKVWFEMKKSKKDGENILTNCSTVVLLKTWMILPFSARI